ncbi:MAG: DUF393 domain-containing protein [Flavipsychrobacter sp.]|nr:DUF393 domain-containing protein [Flavipsychrobacter sp.]
MDTTNNPILYFDGVCNLCNASVQYVIRKDKKEVFRFASLQSRAGEQILHRYREKHTIVPDSILLWHKDKIYVQSDAALHTLILFGGIYKLAVILLVIPRFIRDAVYNFVAKNRYKWFGKKDTCMVPAKEQQHRFLD